MLVPLWVTVSPSDETLKRIVTAGSTRSGEQVLEERRTGCFWIPEKSSPEHLIENICVRLNVNGKVWYMNIEVFPRCKNGKIPLGF